MSLEELFFDLQSIGAGLSAVAAAALAENGFLGIIQSCIMINRPFLLSLNHIYPIDN